MPAYDVRISDWSSDVCSSDLAGACAKAGLSAWEFDVLAALRRAEEPHEMNPAQLIEATMIVSAAMTNRLEKLPARGLVERRPNELDRRRILVRPPSDATAQVGVAMSELVRRGAEARANVSSAHQAELALTPTPPDPTQPP